MVACPASAGAGCLDTGFGEGEPQKRPRATAIAGGMAQEGTLPMQVQPSQDHAGDPASHERLVDKALLDLLLDGHPGLIRIDELRRILVEAPETQTISEPDVSDGVVRLIASGLAYRVDLQLLIASQSAVRAADLLEY